jgi:hypothetical protein
VTARRYPPLAALPEGGLAEHPPRRGFFTQSLCLLLDRTPTLDEVARLLDDGDFDVVGRFPDVVFDPTSWIRGGPTLTVAYRPEVNGLAVVDILPTTWPDGMGSPQKEPALFGAWALGHFGPSAYPEAFHRAVEHAYAFPEMRAAARKHTAFLRLRTSYVLGAGKDAPVLPAPYNPLDELRFLTEIQAALARLPGCLGGFNPNGEMLFPGPAIDETLDRDVRGEALPVDLFGNVRKFDVGEVAGRRFCILDTVGMTQVGVLDHEVVLPLDHPSLVHVPGLLYSMAAYDLDHGGVLGAGDTATDASGVGWRMIEKGEAIVEPPRTILRWAPEGLVVPPGLGVRQREPEADPDA